MKINNKINNLQKARIIFFLQSHLSSFQLQLARVSCNHHCSLPESSCTVSCDISEGRPLWFQLDQSETERGWTNNAHTLKNTLWLGDREKQTVLPKVGSIITSRSSWNEPALLPGTDSSRGGPRERRVYLYQRQPERDGSSRFKENSSSRTSKFSDN